MNHRSSSSSYSHTYKTRSHHHHQSTSWSFSSVSDNLKEFAQSPVFLQIFPLFVICFLPALLLLSFNRARRVSFGRFWSVLFGIIASGFANFGMPFESFGLGWLFGGGSTQGSEDKEREAKRGKHRKRKTSSSNKDSGSTTTPNGKGGSKAVRTRAEQIAMRNLGNDSSSTSGSDSEDSGYYPGLVNISGTYCFMNSTLQALASLTYLQPQIDAIYAKASALDIPTPVIDALKELFEDLNSPRTRYTSIRPTGIIAALSAPPPPPLYPSSSSISNSQRTANSLFNSRDHQDAQELFQLVSECVKNEMMAVDKEGLRDRGMAGVLALPSVSSEKDTPENEDLAGSSLLGPAGVDLERPMNKTVFDGLTANRRSCVVCGYTEAVMHFGFDNWQLAVPRMATSCRIEDCLEDYTRLEILKDCVCRKCSIQATHRRLLSELRTLEEALGPSTSSSLSPLPPPPLSNSFSSLSPSSSMPSSSSSSSPTKSKPSASKKKRYKEVKKMEARVRLALEEGRIEDEELLKDVRLEKVVSPASTKQAMIARPPPVLALHLNRSVHYGQFAAKNTIRVGFPEILDLTPFTTSGSLSTVPTNAISTPSPPPSPYAGSSLIGRLGGAVQDDVDDYEDDSDDDTSLLTAAKSPRSSIPPANSKSPTQTPQDPIPKRSTTPTQSTYAPGTQRVLYRLAAIVCHRGQHSFGHYICYRRKPRQVSGFGLGGKGKKGTSWVPPPTLVDPLLLDGDESGSDDETEDGRSTSTQKAKPKSGRPVTGPRSPFVHPTSSAYYHWLDHAESQVGTGKGWLRISDDDVTECGIETVLGEGSGVFMLYYEKVVHPRVGIYLNGDGKKKKNGVDVGKRKGKKEEGKEEEGREGIAIEYLRKDLDPDGMSIDISGSEETLKPEVKVVDLNGSVGSLISEVGVGVMKVSKKDKERKQREREKERQRQQRERERGKEKENERLAQSLYSISLSSSWGSASVSSSLSSSSSFSSGSPFGARIIRSVNARPRSLPKPVDGDLSLPPPAEMDTDDVPVEMTLSAPSILTNANVTPALANGNGNATRYSGLTATKPQQGNGLGSRSTKVMMSGGAPSCSMSNASVLGQ